jgi:hypothetical protein
MMFNTNRTNHCVMRKIQEDRAMVTNKGISQIQTTSEL